MTTTTIKGTPFTLEHTQYDSKHIVSIYADGNFWDWREFNFEAEAMAFLADPFKTERQQAQQREAREAARIALEDAIAEQSRN